MEAVLSHLMTHILCFFFACEYTENVSGHIQESSLSKAMAVQTFIQGLNSGDQGREQEKFNKLKQS